jgi:HEAT repeat protein
MIGAAPTMRVIGPSGRGDRPREAALLAACAAFDAIAAGILLFGTPLPPLLKGVAAAVSHGAAVLLLSCSTREQPSRRWLSAAAVLAVPCVGLAVAFAIFFTRGRGPTAMGRRRKARWRPSLTTAVMQRLGTALSPCDALDCGDEEQRRAALSALSRREDPEAIALLRRTAAGRDPDLALPAALVLDEIGERAERHVNRLVPTEVRYEAG